MSTLADFVNPNIGVVKLAEVNVSSSVATVEFPDQLTSQYDTYYVDILGVQGDTDNFQIILRSIVNGSVISTDSYNSIRFDASNLDRLIANKDFFQTGGIGDFVTHPGTYITGRTRIMRPSQAEWTLFHSEIVESFHDSAANVQRVSLGDTSGGMMTTDVVEGLHFFVGGTANFIAGTFRLYGVNT